MKTATLVGIVLIVLGVVSLVYQGFSVTTQKKLVDVGSIHATKDEKQRIPLPPVFGWMFAGWWCCLAFIWVQKHHSASGVSSKAANWGQFKTGQRKWPGTVRSCTRS